MSPHNNDGPAKAPATAVPFKAPQKAPNKVHLPTEKTLIKKEMDLEEKLTTTGEAMRKALEELASEKEAELLGKLELMEANMGKRLDAAWEKKKTELLGILVSTGNGITEDLKTKLRDEGTELKGRLDTELGKRGKGLEETLEEAGKKLEDNLATMVNVKVDERLVSKEQEVRDRLELAFNAIKDKKAEAEAALGAEAKQIEKDLVKQLADAEGETLKRVESKGVEIGDRLGTTLTKRERLLEEALETKGKAIEDELGTRVLAGLEGTLVDKEKEMIGIRLEAAIEDGLKKTWAAERVDVSAMLATIARLEQRVRLLEDKLRPPGTTYNAIVFGSSGTGKSSIVNLLVGKDVAPTGNGAKGCTFQSDRYEASVGGVNFALYDTAGLDEDDIGRVPASKALTQLYDLIINQLDGKGVSLLIFCVRAGRISKAVGHNWKLFVDIVCQKKVPVCLAITGLADYQGKGETPEMVMRSWWDIKENQEVFRKLGVGTGSVACITAKRGKRLMTLEDGKELYQFGEEYEASRDILGRAILCSHLTSPWVPTPVKWLEKTTETMREASCWPFSSSERLREVEVPTGAFKKIQSLYNCNEADARKIIDKLAGRGSGN